MDDWIGKRVNIKLQIEEMIQIAYIELYFKNLLRRGILENGADWQE